LIYYNFDNRSSLGEGATLVKDLMGNYDGTVTGATVTADGKINGGFHQLGINNNEKIATGLTYNYSKPFSVGVWGRWEGVGNDVTYFTETAMFGAYSTQTGVPFAYIRENQITFNKYAEGWAGISYTTNACNATWCYLSYVSDNATSQRLYLNGVLVNSGNLNFNQTNTESSFTLGARTSGGSRPMNGTYDEFRFYNTNITADTIMGLYHSSVTKFNDTHYELLLNYSGLNLGEHNFTASACDTADACNSTETRFVTITADGDTCTYSGSGDWEIDCSENCRVSNSYNLANNLFFSGSGEVLIGELINFTGTNQYVHIGSGCSVHIESGGGFG